MNSRDIYLYGENMALGFRVPSVSNLDVLKTYIKHEDYKIRI